MTTSIQNTDLYKKFIKALDIHDMRMDDNPFVVKCCEIAEEYAKEKVLNYAVYIAETIHACKLTPEEKAEVEQEAFKWWEENK